ncbi:hypothetical protein [Agrobacterium tumefaciens]|uniref:hypothetical protein n=1 Tax=Agrobacterium tumefaciens TaxID=358 RepID=UPI0011D23952|nr:hypothetical protein [Agrobacterium tumefaciens]
MTDKTDNEEKALPWGFVRLWSDQEVLAAVEFLKREMPQEWAELEELERTTGDLRDSEVILAQFGALSRLHPDCGPREISNLSWQIRDFRRAALDLD